MKRMKRGSIRDGQTVHVFTWVRYPAHDMCKNQPRPLCWVPIPYESMTKKPGEEITCRRCLAAMKRQGIHEADIS